MVRRVVCPENVFGLSAVVFNLIGALCSYLEPGSLAGVAWFVAGAAFGVLEILKGLHEESKTVN